MGSSDEWLLECGRRASDEIGGFYLPWDQPFYPIDDDGYAVIASSLTGFKYETVPISNMYMHTLCEGELNFLDLLFYGLRLKEYLPFRFSNYDDCKFDA